MKVFKRQFFAAIAYVVAASVTLQPAFAQDSSAADNSRLEEITVTARKREESLLNVPISITAFTADTIEQRGIESIYDLARMTPNLSFNQTYGRAFDRPVIRGMSQILGERTVSFVVDGVYIAGNITGADLDDIESVEVLKGPQAANFGRGSLAGVISYRTRKPSNEFRGKTSISIGDDGFQELGGNISGPLVSDKLTFKLGARYYNYDGQYTAVSSDGRTPTLGAEQTKRVSGT
jgi:outer membrane receptor protein involved in Fe transport